MNVESGFSDQKLFGCAILVDFGLQVVIVVVLEEQLLNNHLVFFEGVNRFLHFAHDLRVRGHVVGVEH